jgi:alpha-tubulin suppressor-like RCC1 family protein
MGQCGEMGKQRPTCSHKHKRQTRHIFVYVSRQWYKLVCIHCGVELLMLGGVGSKFGVPARKNVPTLWVWGSNGSGQLGLGTAGVGRSVPVVVDRGMNWSSVSAFSNHSLAVKTTGTLWAWGSNGIGQLGLGDTATRSSPVQVGTDTNWASVSAGSAHALAVKTTGTLWAWGFNSSGQLGFGDTTNRSSPVQVGTDTDWASVSAGGAHTLAVKTTGTLWAVGNRANGRLGISYIGNVSSPVQVGTAENWNSAAEKFRVYNGSAAVKRLTTQNPVS